MLGKITLTEAEGLRVHTYTAPEDGWRVNTHLIELTDQVIAIDGQYTLSFAQEAVSYAALLKKPLTRLYLTHYHPDHILGAVAFRCPIYALQAVATKIEAVGDRVAREEHEKLGDVIPTHAERPGRVVMPGEEIIDHVAFSFMELRHAETEYALIVGLPEQRILITQDLLYNGFHAFIGEKAFATWQYAIDQFQALPYEHILPGHGDPGGKELFASMKQYLGVAERELGAALDPSDFMQRMISAFPHFGGQVLLGHEMRFLFPALEPH